jgi:S1-C subfamily serine protease
MKNGVDHAIAADLVAISDGKDDADDYAVIKTKEDMGLRGLSIAKKEPLRGEKVMFGCSVGGSAFFLRFGWMTKYHKFFVRGSDGQLHLTQWNEFAYNCTYPSGPGDSGSGIFNIKGQLVGIMYCGINVYEEMYCFANPVSMLHEFLEAHKLGWLAN